MEVLHPEPGKKKPAASTVVTTSPQTVHYVQKNIAQVGLFANSFYDEFLEIFWMIFLTIFLTNFGAIFWRNFIEAFLDEFFWVKF